ncbi:MAG: serine--tRNA ligase [Promethearchaeota archaeon]
MLDLELFRTNLQEIIKSEKLRFKDPTNAEKVVEFDNKWRNQKAKLQKLQQQRNKLSPQIGRLKTQGKTAEVNKLKLEVKSIKSQIENLEKDVKQLKEERDKYRYLVGNILHNSVPIGKSDEDNEILRIVGKQPQFNFKPLSHVELIEIVDGVNTVKAAEIAGSRFYYLRGDIVLLNLALMKYALDKLISKGYSPLWTPFFIKYDVIKAAAELADFEEQLYKVQDEDLYMIATSEQTLAAFHYDEILNPEILPLKYVGVSSCFRREAGSHGKDTLGIFRVHQFEKIEQFILCRPEESWTFHEELLLNSEEIFKELEIPYRVVNIASGVLNDNAAKKYDLEAWFPGSQTYRELVSCSNCLDYQARKLKIRMGKVGSQKEKEIVHTLNSTAIATERTICCLLENYQNQDHSIKIPKVLQKYMNGKKLIESIRKTS